MHLYRKKIDDYINSLDEDTMCLLNEITLERTYLKGELLLRQNEVCRRSFFVLEGVARKYYLNDGKEITTELYFKDDLAVSFDSYTMQQPSREYIEALTGLKVSTISYDAFQEAKSKNPKLLVLDIMLTEYYAIWVEQRLFDFHTLTATQRYMHILHKSPHIVQSIPLTIIASYLGISLETLSRIRAKV